jgi:hypothetical protein
MKKWILVVVTLFATGAGAGAWFDKGHMVVARLAWRRLTSEQRAEILKLLKDHPHYDEFLAAGKPLNMTQDEWVFLRAATWADWVKSGPKERTKYSVPEAHYINLPFVVEGSGIKPPELARVNAVQATEQYRREATAGGDRVKRAVAIAYLMHIVGDIHQPLHCFTLYSKDFPEGDRGGTRALISIKGRNVQLHAFWDGLLGKSTTLSSIAGTVQEIEVMTRDSEAFKEDLAKHLTPKEWADESYEVARTVAHLNGKLPTANADDPAAAPPRPVPSDYPETAGDAARFAAGKAGARLAKVLQEVLAKNE